MAVKEKVMWDIYVVPTDFEMAQGDVKFEPYGGINGTMTVTPDELIKKLEELKEEYKGYNLILVSPAYKEYYMKVLGDKKEKVNA